MPVAAHIGVVLDLDVAQPPREQLRQSETGQAWKATR